MRRCSWRLLLGFVVLVAIVCWGTAAGASSSTTVLTPGQVVSANPTTELPQGTQPADGRLRGPDFQATVTSVAWPATVQGAGGLLSNPTYVAGRGQRLMVFTLQVRQLSDDVGAGNDGTQMSAALVVGKAVSSVDLGAVDDQIAQANYGSVGTGTGTFAASVSVHTHDAVLVTEEGSFSQRFDLWTLRRLPPAPAVLYRSANSSTIEGTSTSGGVQVTLTNADDGFAQANPVQLSSAELTWFAPDGSGATPPSTGDAYLVVALSSLEPSTTTHYFADITPLPGDRLTFTPTGGRPVTATSAPLGANTTPSSSSNGMLDAQYWFTVPADITGGSLSITPGPLTGTEYTEYVVPSPTALSLVSATSLSLGFPPTVSVTAQGTPPWVGKPAPIPPSTGAEAQGTLGGSSGGFPLWAAVLILAVVAVPLFGRRFLGRRPRAAPAPVDVVGLPVDAPGLVAPMSHAGAQPHDDDLWVCVLGPVEFPGWGQPPEGRVLKELCCYLALHTERPVTADQLLVDLWPTGGRKEANRTTLHTYVSRLRRALGEEHLPDAATAGGYRLLGVRTDWAEFRRLVAEAEAASGPTADRLRSEALALVRGEPFAGVAAGQYEWALGQLAHEMTAAVVSCGERLSADWLAAGDPVSAAEAARAGLAASPHEHALWVALLAAVERQGDPDLRRRTLAEAAHTLGPDGLALVQDQVSGHAVHASGSS